MSKLDSFFCYINIIVNLKVNDRFSTSLLSGSRAKKAFDPTLEPIEANHCVSIIYDVTKRTLSLKLANIMKHALYDLYKSSLGD